MHTYTTAMTTYLDRVHERIIAVLEELETEVSQEDADAERRAAHLVLVALQDRRAVPRRLLAPLALVEVQVVRLKAKAKLGICRKYAEIVICRIIMCYTRSE